MAVTKKLPHKPTDEPAKKGTPVLTGAALEIAKKKGINPTPKQQTQQDKVKTQQKQTQGTPTGKEKEKEKAPEDAPKVKVKQESQKVKTKSKEKETSKEKATETQQPTTTTEYPQLSWQTYTPTYTTPTTTSNDYDWKAEYEALAAERKARTAAREEQYAREKATRDAENAARREQEASDLWESLEYAYNKKTEESNAAYDKLSSETDRGLLKRGMQRSSYGAQTIANIGNQKIKAQNDIASEKNSEYLTRKMQLEKEAREEDYKWASFDEQRRQFNENMDFQQDRADVSDYQWQRNFAESQRQFNENLKQGYEKIASSERIAQWGNETSLRTAQMQIDASAAQQDKQLAWDREKTQTQLDYQKGRDTVTDQQWQKQFEASQKAQDQQTQTQAFTYAKMLLDSGVMPTKTQLEAAGLTEEQAKAMLKQKTSGGYTPKPKGNETPQETQKPTDQGLFTWLGALLNPKS